MKITSFFNYCFLASVIVLPAIQLVFLPYGGSGIIQLALSIIALVVSFSDRRFMSIIKTTPILIWLLWVIYTWINWEFAGIKSNLPHWVFVFNRILLTYITLVISYYELRKDLNKTTRFFCILFFIYIFIGLTSQGRIQFSERGSEIFGNYLPLVACSALFIEAFRYRQGYTKVGFLILFFTLAILVSLFAAERKAFVPIILLALFTVMPINFWKTPSRWIPIIFFSIFLYFGVRWVLNNTYVGERMLGTREQGELYTDNRYLVFLGDRAVFYELGWKVFLNHPITGVGLRNFTEITKTSIVIHSEYMVQLVEGGVIGSFLFLIFCFSILHKVRKARSSPLYNIQTQSVCLGELLSLFFLCFYAWTFDQPHYFVSLAVIIAYCDQQLINESYTRKLESAYRG